MTDLSRKPAIGTRARAAYDAAVRKARNPCKCGSGLRPSLLAGGKCQACNPETAARYKRWRAMIEKAKR